jgi:hypothetical protein
MNASEERKRLGFGARRVLGAGMAGALIGAMTLAPIAGAAKLREDDRMVNERVIDRARVENLQRWVSAGHADWCKDARLVAAEELWRLAPDYSGDAFELNAVPGISGVNEGDGNRVTFEWVPLDGRAVYRVTVKRFDWLLSIERNTESMVWVPTSTEIRTRD